MGAPLEMAARLHFAFRKLRLLSDNKAYFDIVLHNARLMYYNNHGKDAQKQTMRVSTL